MAKAGAKSKYERLVKPYLTEINKKVREGVIEAEIAKALNISVATLNNYKNKYPELKEALCKDKGADVLQSLINAGIKAATGHFETDEITVISLDKKGQPSKRQKTTQKRYYPPNPVLNKFYVLNYGKEQGFVSDPLEYELKKAKQEFDEAVTRAENWDKDF